MFRSGYPFDDFFGGFGHQPSYHQAYRQPRSGYAAPQRHVPFEEYDAEDQYEQNPYSNPWGMARPAQHQQRQQQQQQQPSPSARRQQKQQQPQQHPRHRYQQPHHEEEPEEFEEQGPLQQHQSPSSRHRQQQQHVQHPQQQRQQHKTQKPQQPQQQSFEVPVTVVSQQPRQPKQISDNVRLQRLLQRTRAKAATKIQRWYRAILKTRNEQKQDEAARRIQSFMKRAAAVKQAQRYTSALKALRKVEKRIGEIETTYMDRFRGAAPSHSKDMLAFQDALDKAIISLDSIDIHGDSALRAERKRIVKVAQTALHHGEELQQSASKIQAWWRSILDARRETRKPEAAQVIARAMKTLVAKRKAETVASKIKELRQLHTRIDILQTEFLHQLAQLQQQAADVKSSVESDTCDALTLQLAQRIHGIREALAAKYQPATASVAPPQASEATMDTSADSKVEDIEKAVAEAVGDAMK